MGREEGKLPSPGPKFTTVLHPPPGEGTSLTQQGRENWREVLGAATRHVRVVGASGRHVNTGRKQGPRQLPRAHPEALASAGCSARWEMSHKGRELRWGNMLWGS